MCCYEFAYISHNCALKLFGTYNKTDFKAMPLMPKLSIQGSLGATVSGKLSASDQLCQKWSSGIRNQLNLEVSIS